MMIIIIITKWRGYMTIFLRCVSSPWWWSLDCKSKHLALKPHDSISRNFVDSRPWSSQLTNFHHSWMSRSQVICLLLPRRETSPNLQNYRFGPRLRASLAYWFLTIPPPIVRFEETEWFWKYFLQIKQKTVHYSTKYAHQMPQSYYQDIPTIRFHWSCCGQAKWDRVKHADDMEVLPHVFAILVKRK